MRELEMDHSCERCGSKLRVRLVGKAPEGPGDYQAICTKCGKATGSFPDQVVGVSEAVEEKP